MKFFEWLKGPEQSEIDRAIKLLKKHKKKYKIGPNIFYIGTHRITTFFAFFFKSRKRYFSHYVVKFSTNGTKAMISKGGSVDFFFTTKDEVDMLRSAIINHFK